MYNEYNAELARRHVEWCKTNQNAKLLIQRALDKSFQFSGYTLNDYLNMLGNCSYSGTQTETVILPMSSQHTVSKITYMKTTKACVLNFADYYKPGGLFLSGSMVQEESLCHSSGLYPILEFYADDYDDRKGTANKGAYQETGIYTEGCPFWVNSRQSFCDVLTYAAVNWRAFNKARGTEAEKKQVKRIMHDRQIIAYILPKIFGNCDEVILGAWGCGIFLNDTREIAETWRECTERFPGLYKKVYHPLFTDSIKQGIFNDAYAGKLLIGSE